MWYVTILCLYLTGRGSELARERPDGSTVLAYNQDTVDMIDPEAYEGIQLQRCLMDS